MEKSWHRLHAQLKRLTWCGKFVQKEGGLMEDWNGIKADPEADLEGNGLDWHFLMRCELGVGNAVTAAVKRSLHPGKLKG